MRLLELGDGTILVATRPQGGPAGIGTIGLTTINDLGELNQEVVDGAILIKNQVAPDVKIGPNELHLLTRDGQRRDEVGVLGHVAFRDAHGDVHYSAVAFKVLNPYTFRTEGICVSPVKIIATRQNWPAGKIKRSQLRDVAFPSSLDRSNGQALLSAGLSDGEIGELLIPDPFADRR